MLGRSVAGVLRMSSRLMTLILAGDVHFGFAETGGGDDDGIEVVGRRAAGASIANAKLPRRAA
jgi:hypothetical protein